MKYQEIPKELISNWFTEKMKFSLNTEQLNDLCSQIDNHAKINFVRCCTELKGKESMTFDEWVDFGGHRDYYNDLVDNGFAYDIGKLYRRYKKAVKPSL